MKRFITKISIVTFALALLGGIVFTFLIPELDLNILPIALVFFYLLTIVIHNYQQKLAKKNMAKFTRSTMLATFLKLVIYSVFAIVYIALNPENAIPFVVCLMIIYLVFSFIEVTELTKISKSKN